MEFARPDELRSDGELGWVRKVRMIGYSLLNKKCNYQVDNSIDLGELLRV